MEADATPPSTVAEIHELRQEAQTAVRTETVSARFVTQLKWDAGDGCFDRENHRLREKPHAGLLSSHLLTSEKYAGFNHSHLTQIAGGPGGYSPEPSDGKPPSQPPWPVRHQAASSAQSPGPAGKDVPGGHAAADRRWPSSLGGGQRVQIRTVAGRGSERHLSMLQVSILKRRAAEVARFGFSE